MNTQVKTNTSNNGQSAVTVKKMNWDCQTIGWGLDCSWRVTTSDGGIWKCRDWKPENGVAANMKHCSLVGRESQKGSESQ